MRVLECVCVEVGARNWLCPLEWFLIYSQLCSRTYDLLIWIVEEDLRFVSRDGRRVGLGTYAVVGLERCVVSAYQTNMRDSRAHTGMVAGGRADIVGLTGCSECKSGHWNAL